MSSTTLAAPTPDQLKALESQPNIKTVVGSSNGWTQLAFNEYGATKGQTLTPGVGPSTQALWDPAFRDALGYAIDKKDPGRPRPRRLR